MSEKQPEKQRPDWGQLTVDALNHHTSSPEFKASYKKWLEDIGPANWPPVAKADYEAMIAINQRPSSVPCKSNIPVSQTKVKEGDSGFVSPNDAA
jgi:hypothetical protein